MTGRRRPETSDALDTDISHAMEAIKRVADQVWDEAAEEATILEEPELSGVEALGESAIAIRLVMKGRTVGTVGNGLAHP